MERGVRRCGAVGARRYKKGARKAMPLANRAVLVRIVNGEGVCKDCKGGRRGREGGSGQVETFFLVCSLTNLERSPHHPPPAAAPAPSPPLPAHVLLAGGVAAAPAPPPLAAAAPLPSPSSSAAGRLLRNPSAAAAGEGDCPTSGPPFSASAAAAAVAAAATAASLAAAFSAASCPIAALMACVNWVGGKGQGKNPVVQKTAASPPSVSITRRKQRHCIHRQTPFSVAPPESQNGETTPDIGVVQLRILPKNMVGNRNTPLYRACASRTRTNICSTATSRFQLLSSNIWRDCCTSLPVISCKWGRGEAVNRNDTL